MNNPVPIKGLLTPAPGIPTLTNAEADQFQEIDFSISRAFRHDGFYDPKNAAEVLLQEAMGKSQSALQEALFHRVCDAIEQMPVETSFQKFQKADSYSRLFCVSGKPEHLLKAVNVAVTAEDKQWRATAFEVIAIDAAAKLNGIATNV